MSTRARVALGLLLVLLGTAATACGERPVQPSGHVVPLEGRDTRFGAALHVDSMDGELVMMESRVADLERQTLLVTQLALGRASLSPQLPVPAKASENITHLKAAHVKLEIAKPSMGGAVQLSWFELRDDLTPRLALLGRKVAEGSATPAEKVEQKALLKHVHRVNDLRLQVDEAGKAVSSVEGQGLAYTFAQMTRTASRLHLRPISMWTTTDYAFVKRDLELQARLDTVMATATAILATYRGILEGNGDPKALDIVTEAAVEAIPAKRTVTKDEIDKHALSLPSALRAFRPRYEGQLRALYGDEEYERTWAAGHRVLFEYIEGPVQAAGPNAVPLAPGSPPPPPSGKASSEADLVATISTTSKALGFGPVETALRGALAVKRGDVRGAMDAAFELAPVPMLKQAWGLASNLLFK